MDEYEYKTDYPELEAQYDFPSKAVKPEEVNFIVSHGYCADGFMSRVIVEKAMRENPERFEHSVDDVIFFDAYHGADFSDLPEKMEGKVVLICDFSFEPTIFLKMVKATGGRILILDHHITARYNLVGLEDRFKVFDMAHSGAFITQLYVNGFHNVPKAVLYVEDNDIWNKVLPSTLEFTAYMFLQPFEYDSYNQLFDDEYVRQTAIPLGVGAVKQNQVHIDAILSKAKVAFIENKGRYNMVVNVNCANILKSELGAQAMLKFPHANFAACYTQNLEYGSTSFSLRSLDDRLDCSYVAQQFGGGGHRNASGMGCNTLVTKVPGRVLDEYRAYDMLNYVYTRKSTLGRDVLLLNTPVMKTAFARYLMQERYVGERDSNKNQSRVDAKLPNYQEGMFVMRENKQDPSLDVAYDGSVCWNFDGVKNKHFLTICPLPHLASGIMDTLQKYDKVVNGVNPLIDPEERDFSYSENKGIIYVSIDINKANYMSLHHFALSLFNPI